ncbi:phage tail protein [Cellulosilyticum sp. ST5]|uniref:major tail protein n=1 Tax=Cellulosilyticum sp. ST5 TaxID=3055805 RepID=UPI0039776220
MSNKIKYGLKNVHYSPITEITEGGKTTVTFATPIAITGAVNLTLSPVGDTTPFYADNVEYFTAIANNGYDGTLEMALIPDSFKVTILKEVLDTNKVQFEENDKQPAPFALLFEFDGDSSSTRHVMYNCKATRPNIESSTKGQSIEPKTETLTLTCRSLPGSAIIKAKTTSETTPATYDSWYGTVYQKVTEASGESEA